MNSIAIELLRWQFLAGVSRYLFASYRCPFGGISHPAAKRMLCASSSMFARRLARRSVVRRELLRAMSAGPFVGWKDNVATSLSPSIEDMGYGKISNFPLFHDLVQERFAHYGEVRRLKKADDCRRGSCMLDGDDGDTVAGRVCVGGRRKRCWFA